jgi:hypothetical protein
MKLQKDESGRDDVPLTNMAVSLDGDDKLYVVVTVVIGI